MKGTKLSVKPRLQRGQKPPILCVQLTRFEGPHLSIETAALNHRKVEAIFALLDYLDHVD